MARTRFVHVAHPSALFALLAASVLLTGCAAQKRLIAEQSATIDSLYADRAAQQARLVALEDSLQFYDDIDSGQYYREVRTLEDRINKLEYELARCADGPRSVSTLLADDLFEPASATLTESGTRILANLAGSLAEEYPDARFRVEGHSDSVPVAGKLLEKYPTNWELSAARAAAVVRHLVEVHAVAADRLEVVGHGASRPVADNDTAAGRRMNRRVVVTLVPAGTLPPTSAATRGG